MNLALHHVLSLKLGKPTMLESSGRWYRDLTITLVNGQTFTMTVFADHKDSLEF